MRILLLFVALFASMPAMAIVEQADVMPADFDNPEQKARFRALTEELRCTVCQNQNIADSNASLARDVRRQVLNLIKEGKSDEEVVDYLVARYGDFVRYRPPFDARTAVLWLGPFVFLLVGLWTLLAFIRRRNREQTGGALDAEEQAALQETLNALKDHDSSAGGDK